jgi:hypothetical protein
MMDGIEDKIKQAKKAGYRDEDIVQFLAQLPDVGPQVLAALEQQYKPAEILKFLGQSPAYRAGTEKSTLQRGALTALQGPTFGFADELYGAVSAPFTAVQQGIPMGQAYEQGRDVVRGQTESFEQELPFTAAGLQLATSLPMGMISAPAAIGRAVMPAITRALPTVAPAIQAAGRYMTAAPGAGTAMGLGQRTAQAAGSGAGYGFISGLGASNESDAIDILNDAARSSLIGGTLGGVSQPTMSVLGAAGRQATARMSPTAAGTYAQQKVAEALIRDKPENLAPSALNMAQARLLKLGPEARIADVGGKSTRNLLDVQATLPGTTAEAVERAIRERQVGRAGRLMAGADEALGTQNAQFTQSIDNFSNQRFAASRPYYAAIDQSTATVNNSIFDALSKSKGVQGSAELLFRTKTGQVIDLSKLKPGDSVPMNVLDSLKQSLYDTSTELRRAGSNAQAEAYDKVRIQLVKQLEDQAPKIGGQSAYTMAMKTWAGPSQMMDAAEIGRKVMKGDILDIQQATKNLSSSEIDAFRIGVLQGLREKTGTEAGQTSLLKFYKEPSTQARLRAAFGGDFKAFSSSVLAEEALKRFESAGRGSKTAAMLAGGADLDVAPLAQAAGSVASGSPTAILTAASNLARQTQTPEAVRNEIGKILLSRDPRQLQQLSEIIRQLNASRARAAGAAGFGAGQIGGMAPSYFAP